jgi:hypothetical protein
MPHAREPTKRAAEPEEDLKGVSFAFRKYYNLAH